MAPSESVTALHRITRLPLRPTERVFAEYPRMKLGVLDSARHYAQRLLPQADKLIAAGADTDRWVLTAPPLVNIPAGANLICYRLFALLRRGIVNPERLELIDIAARFQSARAREFGRRADYSRMALDQRVASREAESAALIPDRRFAGARVLFVNDINVTGTQQRFMRRYFDPLAPTAVHWLYLIEVDPAIGRAQPQLENAINGMSHGSLAAFADLLASETIEYTGKCLARLFAYPLDRFERVIEALSPERRRRLLELAHREGRFSDAAFGAKIALLNAGTGGGDRRTAEAHDGAR